MASAAASETIMFTGAVLAAAVLVGALVGVGNELSQGMEERADILSDQLQGRINIVNDPAHVTTSPFTLYVKNTGSISLLLPNFVILVDGVASADWDATVGGSPSDEIKPGQLATIIVNDITPASGDHRVVIYSDTNHAATLEFSA